MKFITIFILLFNIAFSSDSISYFNIENINNKFIANVSSKTNSDFLLFSGKLNPNSLDSSSIPFKKNYSDKTKYKQRLLLYSSYDKLYNISLINYFDPKNELNRNILGFKIDKNYNIIEIDSENIDLNLNKIIMQTSVNYNKKFILIVKNFKGKSKIKDLMKEKSCILAENSRKGVNYKLSKCINIYSNIKNIKIKIDKESLRNSNFIKIGDYNSKISKYLPLKFIINI